MAEEAPKQRRLLSRWDIFWLFIVAAIILYVVLKQFGVNVVTRTEKEELIQHPHRDYQD
ncbi:MAG: hypothetical protein KDD02_16350 [Phaeodactylibacter sp.]|nr:hypothetical protein [Phaeodactylibacter sp.]MCB9299355.1 hypothetical protein [Lewinellaceae bacterium]HQU59150.1 hypothetical protein [Saprospiraceae bacterium]